MGKVIVDRPLERGSQQRFANSKPIAFRRNAVLAGWTEKLVQYSQIDQGSVEKRIFEIWIMFSAHYLLEAGFDLWIKQEHPNKSDLDHSSNVRKSFQELLACGRFFGHA